MPPIVRESTHQPVKTKGLKIFLWLGGILAGLLIILGYIFYRQFSSNFNLKDQKCIASLATTFSGAELVASECRAIGATAWPGEFNVWYEFQIAPNDFEQLVKNNGLTEIMDAKANGTGLLKPKPTWFRSPGSSQPWFGKKGRYFMWYDRENSKGYAFLSSVGLM